MIVRTFAVNLKDLAPGSKWHGLGAYYGGNVTVNRCRAGYVNFELPGHGEEEISIADFVGAFQKGHLEPPAVDSYGMLAIQPSNQRTADLAALAQSIRGPARGDREQVKRSKPEIAVTRDAALTVSCPSCKAGPGRHCRDRAGVERPMIHLERFLSVDSWNRLEQVGMDFGQDAGLFA